jgi:CheY-like chemotaxis protein
VKLRVMAVDDEPAVLNLLKAQLEAMGCEVVQVADSREAVERLNIEKVDGLFVDVIMPHMDGFTLTRVVRNSKLNQRVPIVMLTAMDNAETMREGFEAGVNFFLGKPFTRERIHNLLGATRGAMTREKQRYTRLPYRNSVDCVSEGGPQKQFRTSSVDISEGGMLLSPAKGLTVGQEFEMSFSLPDVSRTIRAQARVVRHAPPNGVGVMFKKLAELDEKDLQRYIEARLED